jgi:general secretion pathway protein E/type IV pilus assembly protein PilB
MERASLNKFSFSSQFGEQYQPEFISNRGAIKIQEDAEQVTVGIVDLENKELMHYLVSYHMPKKTLFVSVNKAEFAAYIGETANIDATVEKAAPVSSSSYSIDTVAQDAPIINIINSICIEAIQKEASDIHIEAQADSINVRYRIDGVLRIARKIEKGVFNAISNRIKIMANMNTMEQRLPQDGRITVNIGNDLVDMRVSVIPVTEGESIVLRIFNKNTKILTLDQLGFYSDNLKLIQECARQPYGLILLTGPTGSGKTTTLHALLSTLPITALNIVTIEDPVEQVIPGINQVQINDEINLSFDGILRRVLRQDPNVIMVGEIRDATTAELALRSALTGHLILSTLHTNDSVSVIARLQNMGIEPFLIAAVLRCVVAQRLVRKVCPQCARKAKADSSLQALYKNYNIQSDAMMEPVGCEYCENTGYRGRTVVSEALFVDSVIEEMISRQAPAAEIVAYAKSRGMRSIAEDALIKIAEGVTAISEVKREVIF